MSLITDLDTDSFISENLHIDEKIKEDFKLIQHMEDVFVSIGEKEGWQHGPIGGAPCQRDLRFIYLMTMLIKPKTALEIGTWSGLSAHVIALAMSNYCKDYSVDTCDVVNVYQTPQEFRTLSDNIVFHNCHSTHFLMNTGQKNIDLVFSDASIGFNDAALIKSKFLNNEVFFMTHDVYPHKREKGNVALDVVSSVCEKYDMMRFVPNKLETGYPLGDFFVNACTGFVVSKRLL